MSENSWRHLGENNIAANAHPTLGGIIDKMTSGRFAEEWFIIFNHPDLDAIEGLASKSEAFEVFAKTLAENGLT